MSIVLDAGALSSLSVEREVLRELNRRGLWRVLVPAVVLVEALTGDHRRDFHVNRLLRTCRLVDVDETLAREGSRLRTATGRAGTISAVDAIVAALAGRHSGSVVITSDAGDLQALSAQSPMRFGIVGV